ncbi:MAG: hypothetical protein KDD16_07595 [Mangrovimonas sp.]|nr:hypothetical protein [Mangrovimonas sp.]
MKKPRTFEGYDINNEFEVLTWDEIMFLRLSLLNQSVMDIAEFLNMSLDKVLCLKEGIFRKLKTKNWLKIVVKAFERGILDPLDYLNPIVKDVASGYSTIVLQKALSNESEKILEVLLFEFYQKVTGEIWLTSKEALSIQEVEFVNLKFMGMNEESILKKMGTPEIFLEATVSSIESKLKIREWFLIFKRLFEIQILNTTQYLSVQIEIQSFHSVEAIKECVLSACSEKEKRLFCYNELLRFYSNLEQHLLLRQLKVSN